MRICELCTSTAKLYCDSDRASLCWDCDTNVHGANFLVARHLRTLLCRSCQSPTPWSASGALLNTTLSVCGSCVDDNGVGMDETVAVRRCQVRDDDVSEIRDDIYWDGDTDDDDHDMENKDNQVVWCSTYCSSPTIPPPGPPPPASQSSTS